MESAEMCAESAALRLEAAAMRYGGQALSHVLKSAAMRGDGRGVGSDVLGVGCNVRRGGGDDVLGFGGEALGGGSDVPDVPGPVAAALRLE